MKILVALILLSAGFAAITLLRAAARERAAVAAFPPEGRLIDVDGQTVHAVLLGSGPDLVLIHGSSGNWRDFTFGLAQALSAHYRVIMFDRPGLGHSTRLPAGREGIREQARLLGKAAVMLGAERPIVVGQSYGGAVALAWAIDRPDNIAALVTLAGPSHPWHTPLPLLYRLNSSALGSALFVPLLTAWVPEAYVDGQIASVFAPQQMPAGYAEHIAAPLTLRRESLRANAIQRAVLEQEIAALVPSYRTLGLPFELVHGTSDDTVSLTIHAEAMVREAPTANLTRLEGIGHMPHHVARDAVIAAIDRAARRSGLR